MCIVIKISQNVSLEDIVRMIEENDVAKYKVPEFVELLDAITGNPVGKAKKGVLRKPF